MYEKNPGEILADALERSPQEREAFLLQACGDDAALLADVRSLLDAHARADGLLPSDWLCRAAPGLAAEGVGLAGVSPDREVGRQIGAYRLRQVLGAGGMGAVYVADRTDAEFVKQVAIKLVRPGMGTEDVLQRFWTERQVLANLEHPNIARLLDGGATDDRLPYLVMELVNGVPIDVYADTHRLSVADRLQLFLSVCGAVAFAHRNLVVHRDIKPGNILVDESGVPKLLDFGIAKILDPAESGSAAAATRTGMRLLTPEYASPEQVRGDPVTTATDVYSLGVLLYELLTGRRPYAIRSRGPIDLERAVCETEPDRPSTVVTENRAPVARGRDGQDIESLAHARGTQPDRLRRQLAGDLDNIVLMALRKEPERRYPSVERLASDIQRHLDGLPVTARKDTWRYRSAKFARRNRLAVGAAGTVFLVVAMFGVIMAFQAQRLARERDRVRQEAETSKRISEFLTELFQVTKPEQALGKAVTAREILDAGAKKIQQGLEEEPAVRAELLRTMGGTYWSLGAYGPACSLLAQATELQTALYGPDDNEHLAGTLIALAIAYRSVGRTQDCRALYERAVKIRTQALPPDHLDMALLHNNYGTVLFDMAEYAGARQQFELAIAIWEKGPEKKEITAPLRSLTHVALQDRDFKAAEKYGKRSVEIAESEFGAEHPETIRGLINLGVAYNAAQKFQDAVVALEKALPLSERVFGPQHQQTAWAVNTLAGARLGIADTLGARELFARSIELRRASGGPRHASVANPLYRLAAIEGELGDTASALARFREATSILEDAGGPNQPSLPGVLIQHGKLLVKLGEYVQAESLMQRADRISQSISGASHPRMVQVLLARGDLERSRRHYREAETYCTRAVKISSDAFGADHQDTVDARKAYARLLREMGEGDRAAALER